MNDNKKQMRVIVLKSIISKTANINKDNVKYKFIQNDNNIN